VAESHDAWLILSELRTLLHQHIEHLRMVAAGKNSGQERIYGAALRSMVCLVASSVHF
jgi:hypothetical protein